VSQVSRLLTCAPRARHGGLLPWSSRCSPSMPTACSTKVLKGINLPVEGRGDSIQTKLGNQTH
jgi:hypothetical protein